MVSFSKRGVYYKGCFLLAAGFLQLKIQSQPEAASMGSRLLSGIRVPSGAITWVT